MPELPEVERCRRLIERLAVGRTIVRAWCDDDRIVFDRETPRRISRHLKGRTVESAHRRGKHLWLALDERPWPVFHLGMTGWFHSPSERPIRLQSSGSEDDQHWPPPFMKLHLTFDDDGELVMTNKRRFGRIRLADDPRNEPPISRLGFDPLDDLPPPEAFADLLRKRKAPVKAVLLDQRFAAGVGNWIADEILYQAKIDPRRSAQALSEAEAKRVRTVMKRVVTKAVDADAEKSRYPKTWLFHHRWGRKATAKTARGEKIEHLKVAGRTTAWVPSVQR